MLDHVKFTIFLPSVLEVNRLAACPHSFFCIQFAKTLATFKMPRTGLYPHCSSLSSSLTSILKSSSSSSVAPSSGLHFDSRPSRYASPRLSLRHSLIMNNSRSLSTPSNGEIIFTCHHRYAFFAIIFP